MAKCKDTDWLRIGFSVCYHRNLSRQRFFSGDRHKAYCRARWAAWRQLHSEGFSANSIAEASGFCHTTVNHALTCGHDAFIFNEKDLRHYFPSPSGDQSNRNEIAAARRAEFLIGQEAA